MAILGKYFLRDVSTWRLDIINMVGQN